MDSIVYSCSKWSHWLCKDIAEQSTDKSWLCWWGKNDSDDDFDHGDNDIDSDDNYDQDDDNGDRRLIK